MQKPHVVFLSAPFSGIEVSFRKMQPLVERRDDIESSWIYVEWEPPEIRGMSSLVLRNWTLKASEVARRRVNSLTARGRRVDAIVANSIVPMLFLTRRATKVPIFLSLDATPRLLGEMAVHYSKSNRWGASARIWLDRELVAGRLYRSAARMFPWSEFARESLLRDYRVHAERVTVLPPGIDLSGWPRPEPFSGATRAPGATKILFVGGDFVRKGGDLVLRLSRLPEFSECDFHLATRRFEGEKGANVHVHEGLAADSSALRELFLRADLFLMPTRADFAPTMAVCEALASGLPVITSRIGGMDSVILDGRNGFVAPVGDFDALARHSRELVQNTQLRHRMAEEARATAEEKFDLAHNADHLMGRVLQASNHGGAMSSTTVDGANHE
jgi:glycosyltransferase involved in cell wall biosynthesis